jgi:hypothetical protein
MSLDGGIITTQTPLDGYGDLQVLQDVIYNTNVTYTSIITDSVTSSNIYSSNITSSNVFTNTINTSNLYATEVYTSNLYVNEVYSSNLYANIVNTSNMFANVVNTSNLFTSQIYASNITVNYINSSNIISTNIISSNISSSNVYANSITAHNGTFDNIISKTITNSSTFRNTGYNAYFGNNQATGILSSVPQYDGHIEVGSIHVSGLGIPLNTFQKAIETPSINAGQIFINGQPLDMTLATTGGGGGGSATQGTLGSILGGLALGGVAALGGGALIYAARMNMFSSAVSATGNVVASATTATGSAVATTAAAGHGVGEGIGAADVVIEGAEVAQMPAGDAIASMQAAETARATAAGLSQTEIQAAVAGAAGNPVGRSLIGGGISQPIDLIQNVLTKVRDIPLGQIEAGVRTQSLQSLTSVQRIFERALKSGGFQVIETAGSANIFNSTAFWNTAIAGTKDVVTGRNLSALQFMADASTGVINFNNSTASTAFQTLANLGKGFNTAMTNPANQALLTRATEAMQANEVAHAAYNARYPALAILR